MNKNAEATIDPKRLARLDKLTLDKGAHAAFAKGHCAMELVSYLAKEKFSDAPQCACPVITRVVMSWNDSIPDDETRTRLLRPLLPLIVGTRAPKTAAGDAVLLERMYIAMDWHVRTFTPAWLRLAGLEAEAVALEKLAAIVDATTLQKAEGPARIARDRASAAESAAWSAAWSAARSAAWSAAESAAWSAARSAAWSAAWSAARSAARSAAWSAARSAAWSAAWSAAESAAESAARSAAWSAAESAADRALADTVAACQASAVEMVRRMCAVPADVEAADAS